MTRDREVDEFDRDFRRMARGIVAVCGFVLSPAAAVAVIWALVALVRWVTAQ